MKITEKLVCRVVDSVREDLCKIAEENAERLLKALDEQERAGGDSSISLSITVCLTDKGAAENAVEVATKFGFARKVQERDEYIPHVIDLGESLFDHAKRKTSGKDAAAEGGAK